MNLKEKSYVFGLLGTDGNLSLSDRNRGRVSLEINIKDRDICEKLFNLIPNSTIKERTRDTNFKNGYHSIVFLNHQLSFRQELIDFGFPVEDKTNNFSTPSQEYSEKDFWRGVIDGDGSIGYTAEGFPFVSLVTKSEFLKEEYCMLLLKHFNIKKNISRNKRDNVYNIVVYKEDAQELCKYLYSDATLYLERKYQKALDVLKWVRPASMKKAPTRKPWDEEQDNYILSHTIEESMKHLNRTKQSIRSRLFRLSHK